MEFFLFLIIAIFLVWMLYLYLIRPEKIDFLKYQWLKDHEFAHRGLYLRDQSIPENSLAAFRRALEHGYGIELDLQMTKDEEVVVFHDDTLLRMTGVDKMVGELTYREISSLTLLNTDSRIPLFSDVLKLADGKEPLIVELKTGQKNILLCQKAYALLRKYKGEYCVQSFNPSIVRWFYKNAPEVLRGQLSSRFPIIGSKNSFVKYLLGKLVFNRYAHPQFIAYNIKHSSLSLDLCRKLGAATIAWGVKTETGLDKAKYYFDAYIFEELGQPDQ